MGKLLEAGLQLTHDLLLIESLRPSRSAAFGDVLAAGARGILAAAEAQAMVGLPRQAVDLLVSVARLHGSFVVTAMAASSVERTLRHSPAPCTTQVMARRLPVCCANECDRPPHTD